MTYRKRRGGENHALYPKVKRVYIAGNVKNWQVGTFTKRTGKTVHGVKIEYEQSRASYQRKGYTAARGSTQYTIAPAQVRGTTSVFSKIVEVPENAQHVKLHTEILPAKYGAALQDVR